MPACRRAAAVALLFVLCAAAPVVAGPRDNLLRFVPDDVAFCLVVQDLRGQSARLLASPFAQQWARSAAAAGLAGSREWKQLGGVEGYIKKHFDVGWAELRDDVLGDAFLFAYRPGPPGKPEQEQGMFLLEARNEATLAGLIKKLNDLQLKTGELKA